MTGDADDTTSGTVPPAGHGPVDRGVRPLSARLSLLRVLLAQHHREHHAAVHEAVLMLERWENYRGEMASMERRMGRLARNFLECEAWEDAAKCALKADAMRWVRGRMPPAA